MTPERLAELKALCDAATPGPWRRRKRLQMDIFDVVGGDWGGVCCVYRKSVETQPGAPRHWRGNDVRFISLARTAVPELIAEVERLQEELTEAKCMLVKEHRATQREAKP